MKCRKCKSDEFNPSRRNPIERAVGQILPIRPYRCSACEARTWGPDKPLFGLGRVIFAAIVSLSVLWFVAVMMLSGNPQNPPVEPVTQSAEQNPGGDAPEGAQPTTPPELEENQEPMAQTGEDGGANEAAQPEVVVEDPPVSDFVKEQLTRNRQKQGIAANAPNPAAPVEDRKPISKARAEAEPPALEKPKANTTSPLRLGAATIKPGGTSLALAFTGEPGEERLMRLDNPHRIVVDLPGKWSISRQVTRKLQVDSDLVKRIRIGPNPGFLRIVFDLTTPRVKDPDIQKTPEGMTLSLEARE